MEQAASRSAWKSSKFRIAADNGKMERVAGAVSSCGLGVYRMTDKPDVFGRYDWSVTHLNTGRKVVIVKAVDQSQAGEIVDIFESVLDWNAVKKVEDMANADPFWVPRLLGIKHTLGGDWIQMLNPRMNDPGNIVWGRESEMSRH